MGKKVVVIGAGAAGLVAAGIAAQAGCEVSILEKTGKIAQKVRITGKGRCNITNMADKEEFIASFPRTGSFLYSAFSAFSNWDVMAFFQELGVQTKDERGGRVFPVSDDANQVANALLRFAKAQGATVFTEHRVSRIDVKDKKVVAVKVEGKSDFPCDKVIIATGGASYPATGSSGDGYKLARQLGHTVHQPLPSLVPLRVEEDWVKELAGLSLRNVELHIVSEYGKDSLFGELLFAHFGLTGPIVLTLSEQVARIRAKDEKARIQGLIDLKPALSEEQLDARIQRDFDKYSRKQYKNSLGDLLPKALIPIIIQLSGISPEKQVNQISREERHTLVEMIKGLPLTIRDTLPLAAAIVTAGGVDVREVNPRTMESKLISGLHFAGEVLDINGITGGFNLQAAFSTGFLCGKAVTRKEE